MVEVFSIAPITGFIIGLKFYVLTSDFKPVSAICIEAKVY